MKIGRFFAGLLVLLAVHGVAMAAGETPSNDTGSVVLATDTYVQGAYSALDGKKQEKLTNTANAGNNISIDDTTKKISLDLSGLPQVSGNDANGVYVLTATVENGVATLKWEKIERDGNQVRDGNM